MKFRVKKGGKYISLPPTYCEACHRKVEYDYESNGYYCPEHDLLIFLSRGIPRSLIATWWGGTVIPIAINGGKREMKQPKVVKVENTPNYGVIYTVMLPVRFYFNKDGSYDRICFDARKTTEKESELVKELNDKLGNNLEGEKPAE